MAYGKRGKVQVTFDCADPVAQAWFWAAVLGYPPPDVLRFRGYLRSHGTPDDELDNWSLIEDPEGVGPRLFFQKVPEPKVAKNRLHLDVRVGTERPSDRAAIDAEAARLLELGASRVREVEDGDGYFVVLQDPEGNEFCVD